MYAVKIIIYNTNNSIKNKDIVYLFIYITLKYEGLQRYKFALLFAMFIWVGSPQTICGYESGPWFNKVRETLP